MDGSDTLTSFEVQLSRKMNELYDHDPETFRILTSAAVLLVSLLYFDYKHNNMGMLITKTPLSLLFVYSGYLQVTRSASKMTETQQQYADNIMLGLICGVGGDVLLVFKHRLAFLAGLVVFLVGHVFYVIAFVNVLGEGYFARDSVLTEVHAQPIAATLVISVVVFLWLRPYMSKAKMLLPGLGYCVVITCMVIAAVFVYCENTMFDVEARHVIISGAILFYISDLFVARQRFVTSTFFNRFLGLPLYYIAQFLIAHSIERVCLRNE